VVQDAILAGVRLLEVYGHQLGRPHVDTLNGAKHANLKELLQSRRRRLARGIRLRSRPRGHSASRWRQVWRQ
jgi:hypothetical protein